MLNSVKLKGQGNDQMFMMMGIAIVVIFAIVISTMMGQIFTETNKYTTEFCNEHPEICNKMPDLNEQDISSYNSNGYLFCALKSIGENDFRGSESCDSYLYSNDNLLTAAFTIRITEFAAFLNSFFFGDSSPSVTGFMTLKNSPRITLEGMVPAGSVPATAVEEESEESSSESEDNPLLFAPPPSVDCNTIEGYPEIEYEEDCKGWTGCDSMNVWYSFRKNPATKRYEWMWMSDETIKDDKGYLPLADMFGKLDDIHLIIRTFLLKIRSGTEHDRYEQGLGIFYEILTDKDKHERGQDLFVKGIALKNEILDNDYDGHFDDYIIVHYGNPHKEELKITTDTDWGHNRDKLLLPDSEHFKKEKIVTDCEVKNFYLPQEIEDHERWIAGMGDPLYVVYWQTLADEADASWSGAGTWMTNAIDITFAWVNVGGVLSVGKKAIGFAAKGAFSKITGKVASEVVEETVEKTFLLSGKKFVGTVTTKAVTRETAEGLVTETTKTLSRLAGKTAGEGLETTVTETTKAVTRETAEGLVTETTKTLSRLAGKTAGEGLETTVTEVSKKTTKNTVVLFGKEVVKESPTWLKGLAFGKDMASTAIKYYKPRLMRIGIPATAGALISSYIDGKLATKNPISNSLLLKMPYQKPVEMGRIGNLERSRGFIMVETNDGVVPLYLASPCFADLKIKSTPIECGEFSAALNEEIKKEIPIDNCADRDIEDKIGYEENCYKSSINGDIFEKNRYTDRLVELVGYSNPIERNPAIPSSKRDPKAEDNPLRIYEIRNNHNQQKMKFVSISLNPEEENPEGNEILIRDPFSDTNFVFGTGYHMEDGVEKFDEGECDDRGDSKKSTEWITDWKDFGRTHKEYFGGDDRGCQKVNLQDIELPYEPDSIKILEDGDEKIWIIGLSDTDDNFNFEIKADMEDIYCEYTIPPSGSWLKVTLNNLMPRPYPDGEYSYKKLLVFSRDIWLDPVSDDWTKIRPIIEGMDDKEILRSLASYHQLAYRAFNDAVNPGEDDSYRGLYYKDMKCYIKLNVKPTKRSTLDSKEYEDENSYLEDVNCLSTNYNTQKGRVMKFLEENKNSYLYENFEEAMNFYCDMKEYFNGEREIRFDRQLGLSPANLDDIDEDGIPNFALVETAALTMMEEDNNYIITFLDTDMEDTVADTVSIDEYSGFSGWYKWITDWKREKPKISFVDMSKPKDGIMDIVNIRDCKVMGQLVEIDKKDINGRNFCVAEKDKLATYMRWAPLASGLIGGAVGSIVPGWGTAGGFAIGDKIGAAVLTGYIIFYESKHGRSDQWPGKD